MGLRGSEIVYRGWEGKSKGLGITHRSPARAAAPSLAPWAGGKGGERAGGLRGESGVAARCGLLRAHPRGGLGPGLPPPRPRKRARLAQPCFSELEAGRMGGAGSRGGAKVARVLIGERRWAGPGGTDWAGHWLRGPRLKSAIGSVGLSRGGYWLRGAEKMSPRARMQ